MEIKILSKNIELTQAIQDYVEKRVTNLGKLLSKIEEERGEVFVYFEVGKSTQHHKKGEFFHTDCSVKVAGENFYASADEEDLYVAIDAVKESLFNKINKKNEKRRTLFKRGASSVKKMMKGLSKRNPFTSKY